MDRRTFMKGGIALAATARATVATAEPNTDILALGVEFEKSWAAEKEFFASHDLGDPANDAGFEEVYLRTENYVHLIEKAEATTVEALRVKARAVQWCYGDDELQLDGSTTDVRLASQIVKAILTI